MLEHLLWFFNAHAYATGWTPALRAALICGALYQLDLCLVLGFWLLRKSGAIDSAGRLRPNQRKPAMLVLPTLLREESDLEGLQHAALSAACNGYPGSLTIVLCIDGSAEQQALFERLSVWAKEVDLPERVHLFVVGTPERAGKAVAIEAGVAFARELVQRGELRALPEIFFNMDADSSLGERALERMAYQLQRRRRIARAPHLIVTSNVIVPFAHCHKRGKPQWLTLLVAREYLSSITYSKFNWKIFPCTEVSGALYCTWTAVHLAAPYYARFMQSLTLGAWARWWLGFGPPLFSQFRGEPLPEAMTGPGDDTWMAWLASTAMFRDGQLSFDAPRTPLHAFGRMAIAYVSRPVTYDPLAKVFTKTPSTANALFRQRLRWNSSRIQDLKRWGLSHLYHWQLGFPLYLATLGLVLSVIAFVFGLIGIALDIPAVHRAAPLFVLLGLGYSATRVTSTLAALIASEAPRTDYWKLTALVLAGPYHLAFNTATLCLGYIRDIAGFGEPTTFAPEETLRRSGLSRVAFAYRLRRAVLLAMRAARYGDVPFGRFWFGWRQTRWTSSGFDGWTTGKRPPPIYWRDPPDSRGDEAQR